MSTPISKSKAEQAFQQLVELSNKRRPVDELSLARFERAARESLSIDPVTSRQLMGAIAAYRWDAESIHSFFSEAIGAGGGHEVWSNYATALRFMNRTREAAPFAERAVSLAPTHLTYLKEAITNRICLGDWGKADELIDLLAVRATEVDDDLRQFQRVISFAREIGLYEHTVGRCMDVALEFLENERVRFHAVSDWVDELSDDGSIYLDVLVNATVQEAESLDERLTPLLFDRVEDLQLSIFSLTIKAVAHAD